MFRSQLNAKIGNLINYLSSKIPDLSLTKALKLLYLIDETSYQRTGSSVTWLDYKVWQMGPVAEEVYNELKFDQRLVQAGKSLSLEGYISTEKVQIKNREAIQIKPVGEYSNELFTVAEWELINNIITRFGSYNSTQLINLLHEKNTLWHKYVKENNLELNFKVYGKKSNHTIDFSELIKDDPIKQVAAQAAFESMQFHDDLETA